jgi:hypothetical protein
MGLGKQVPYVQRDEAGRIIAVSVDASGALTEWIEIDHPDLRAYLTQVLGGAADAVSALAESDLALIRVVEDLVNTLIAKDLLHFTDLPDAAQQKLLQRRTLRSSANALRLLREDDQGLI